MTVPMSLALEFTKRIVNCFIPYIEHGLVVRSIQKEH